MLRLIMTHFIFPHPAIKKPQILFFTQLFLTSYPKSQVIFITMMIITIIWHNKILCFSFSQLKSGLNTCIRQESDQTTFNLPVQRVGVVTEPLTRERLVLGTCCTIKTVTYNYVLFWLISQLFSQLIDCIYKTSAAKCLSLFSFSINLKFTDWSLQLWELFTPNKQKCVCSCIKCRQWPIKNSSVNIRSQVLTKSHAQV